MFRDIKSCIKHMTYTDEFKTLKEYVDNRTLLINQYSENSARCQEGLQLLEREYAKLLKKQSITEPAKKLKTL